MINVKTIQLASRMIDAFESDDGTPSRFHEICNRLSKYPQTPDTHEVVRIAIKHGNDVESCFKLIESLIGMVDDTTHEFPAHKTGKIDTW